MNDELSQRVVSIRRIGALAGIFMLTFVMLISIVRAEHYVHLDYDWEGDDANEQDPQPKFESCFPCHGEKHPGSPKVCEDCHLPNGTGPYEAGGDFVLRADYDAPVVYEHYYNAEDIDVDNQSYGIVLSTCFSFDPVVGGTCHGVSYVHRDRAGGYFAFNENWTEGDRGRDPYEYTAPASFLPDTADCLFCHNQDDEEIRYAWGDAAQINSTHSAIVNEECYRCHMENSTGPSSFHSQELYLATEDKSREETAKHTLENKIMIAGFILMICIFSIYLLRRIKGNRK